MPDQIHIRDVECDCVIGVNAHERDHRQRIVINITLACDLAAAGASDRLADTVDYKALKDRIIEFVGSSAYFLIERLAEELARMCLEDGRVLSSTVTIDKPGALTGARSVAVQVERTR